MTYEKKKIIIITAPSGAGKTSITRYLLEKWPDKLVFSVSATTRSPRVNEKDGIDYYFLSLADFKNKIREKEFAEWEMVYEGKYYGTLKTEMERIWGQNKFPVLDIDVKGAIHIQQQYPEECLSIFIQPPSLEELRRRLQSRGTETEASINSRVNKASYEISFSHHFSKIVVNDDLVKAREETESIVLGFLQS